MRLQIALWVAVSSRTILAQGQNDNGNGNRTLTTIEIDDKRYGHRNVTYWLAPDGQAVIDGDVIYGPEAELLLARVADAKRPRRAFSIRTGPSTWPSGVIRYNYENSDTEFAWKTLVEQAIYKWNNTARYLTFVKLANNIAAQPGVLTIRSQDCGDCTADVGFRSVGTTMFLQRACPATMGGSCGLSSIVHEFGHVLGLHHEHQRPDAASFVRFQREALLFGCTTMPGGKDCSSSGIPAECCQVATWFLPLPRSGSADASGPYDSRSIMHYDADQFARFGMQTLTGVGSVVVPLSHGSTPTTIDFHRLCKIYSAQCPLALDCHSRGCPANCNIITPCTGLVCRDPDETSEPPPCCTAAGHNARCEQQRRACSDCSFLSG